MEATEGRAILLFTKLRSNFWILACTFGVLLVGGIVYITAQYRAFDTEVHARLGEIAKAKTYQIAAWRSDHIADISVLARGIQLMPAVRRVILGEASGEDLKQATAWAELVMSEQNYEGLILTNPQGEAQLSVGNFPGDAVHSRALTERVRQSNEPILDEITEPGKVVATHFGVSVALRNTNGELTGALLTSINPERFLYRTLRDWSGGGRTGEIALVRRNGEAILPAISHGARRGEAVIAETSSVIDSDWVVVVKADRSEIMAPVRRNTMELSFLLVAIVMMGAGTISLFLRRKSELLYREKYEIEVERNVLLSRYEALARGVSEAILIWKDDGQIIEVNDRAIEMFGYTREEITQLTVPDLKPLEAAGDFVHFRDLLQEKPHHLYKTFNQRKDGTAFPTEISAGKIQMGGEFFYHGVIRDISERKLADDQIKRLTRLYAVLRESISATFRVQSEQELFDEVCRIAVEVAGFRVVWIGRSDYRGTIILPVARSGDQAAYLDEIRMTAVEGRFGNGPAGRCLREQRAIASTNIETDPMMAPWREAARRHELRSTLCLPIARRGDVSYLLGIYSSEAGVFNAGEISLAEEVGHNLSVALDRIDLENERAAAEQERLQATDRLELAMDAANEAYWDWKVDTDEWFFSPRYYSMAGYSPDEMNFRYETGMKLIYEDDRAEVLKHLEQLVRGERLTTSAEFRIVHKQGHLVWIQAKSKVAARDEQGRTLRIVGTHADITERKLLERQFLQAQKMESIGRLAGGVAHDFRNHLTVINGYTELILERQLADSPLIGWLQTIKDAGEAAAALTRQLLAFSRREFECREQVNPNMVITGVQKMITRLMGENVDLQLELDPDPGTILADVTQIEQLVMNLIINARDAVEQDGRIIVRTKKLTLPWSQLHPDRSGTWMRLTVEDNGCGMSQELQQHIFEPFFTTKDKAHGTGLGLATVYGIVEHSGGFIEVESEPGVGSSFYINLPVAAVTEYEVPAEVSGVPELCGDETILLVDDEPNIRRVTKDILEHYGYKVLQAAGGAVALAVSETFEGNIDAIITDIMMPGMRGPELARLIRRSRPEVKVLFISGYAGGVVRVEELEAHGGCFLAKPYQPKVLAAKLRELLSGGAASAVSAK